MNSILIRGDEPPLERPTRILRIWRAIWGAETHGPEAQDRIDEEIRKEDEKKK